MTQKQANESKRIQSRFLLKSSCDLENLLIGEIQTLLTAEFDSQTQLSMLALLDRLIMNLPVSLELSSKDGYLSMVLEERPGLSRQIDSLYQANLDCVLSLKRVRTSLKKGRSIVAFSQELELRLKNWLKSFSVMRSLECTMLQKAYSVDIGGEA